LENSRETNQGQEMIQVWTTPNCVQCRQTKKLLDKHNISYDSFDLTQHPEELENFKALGLVAAPIVVSGDTRWSGFRFEKLKRLIERVEREKS